MKRKDWRIENEIENKIDTQGQKEWGGLNKLPLKNPNKTLHKSKYFLKNLD